MTTRYKVHCRPSFHPEMEIEVLFEDEGELDGWQGGIDGCFFTCGVQNARGAVHTFSAWSPPPDRSPLQHAFISLVHRLAVGTIREPTTAKLLKQLGGYI